MQGAILVVDDDPDIRLMVSMLLRRRQFPVETAESGASALEQVKKHGRPDMILLDLMMPDMDGWTFRQKMLEDVELAGVPVILLSAANDVARHAARLGVAAYLTKPFESSSLFRLIETYYQPH